MEGVVSDEWWERSTIDFQLCVRERCENAKALSCLKRSHNGKTAGTLGLTGRIVHSLASHSRLRGQPPPAPADSSLIDTSSLLILFIRTPTRQQSRPPPFGHLLPLNSSLSGSAYFVVQLIRNTLTNHYPSSLFRKRTPQRAWMSTACRPDTIQGCCHCSNHTLTAATG